MKEFEKTYNNNTISIYTKYNKLRLYDNYNGFNFECDAKNINVLIDLLKELREDNSELSANTGHYIDRFIGRVYGNNVRLCRCKHLIEALEDFKSIAFINKEDLKKLTKAELLEKLNSLDLNNLEIVMSML